MLRRITALTGLSAGALLVLTPSANAALPADEGVGLTYGVTMVVIDTSTDVARGVLEIAGLYRG